MRHLFVVHSHTTYRCALGIIRHLELDSRDCVFGTTRGFKPSLSCDPSQPIPSVPLDFLGLPNGNAIRPVLRILRMRKALDRQIDEIMGHKIFHTYLPHTYYDPYQLLATHPHCLGFSYIEEGLTSYYAPGEIKAAYPPWRFSWRTRKLREFLFGNRLRDEIPFFRDDYTAAYGFTDQSFPQFPRRLSLGIEFLFGEMNRDALAASPVLVFDALVELKLTSVEALLHALDEFLNALVLSGCGELYFKFHPSQAVKTSVQPIREHFSRHAGRLKIEQMPENLSLEDYFCRHDPRIFVFNSAAGLYASLLGRKVNTLNRLIEQADPEYRARTARLPAVFHQLVQAADLNHLGCLDHDPA